MPSYPLRSYVISRVVKSSLSTVEYTPILGVHSSLKKAENHFKKIVESREKIFGADVRVSVKLDGNGHDNGARIIEAAVSYEAGPELVKEKLYIEHWVYQQRN